MSNKTYKIGARGSLLSVTQSTIVKNQLEEVTGDKFEIIKIKTQGDQIQDKPLWQLEGKDFFTKELDAALLKEEVDLVIHSYKDLGSERPEGIKIAAITKRMFPHDILLIKKETINWLKEDTTNSGDFIVGTSSPRRITNIERKIDQFLPHLQNKKVKCETLRGNVNTRIQKLKDGNYHAIILALAGVERLAHLENSLEQLKELLDGLSFCVLPLSELPSAASQGALAIEINENRDDNGELAQKLNKVNCPTTVEEMKRERAAFQSYGGGCHLAVGIHSRKINEGFMHFEQGKVDETVIVKKSYEQELNIIGDTFSGMRDDILIKEPLNKINKEANNIFITSRHCLNSIDPSVNYSSIWSSGIRTHKKLIEAGHWINGSADVFGHDEIISLKNSKAIQLMLTSDKWQVHTNAKSTSEVGETYEAYTKKVVEPTSDQIEKLHNTNNFYWTSFHQFEVYKQYLKHLMDENVNHFCGFGKTLEAFQAKGIKVTPVLSIKDIL